MIADRKPFDLAIARFGAAKGKDPNRESVVEALAPCIWRWAIENLI